MTLAALCKRFGPDVFVNYGQEVIFCSIRDNLERGDQGGDKPGAYAADTGRPVTPPMVEGNLLHESAGWRSLETGCQ